METESFRDRVIIVTGGAGGVGRTVTLRWLQAGASVLVPNHAQPSLDALRAAWSGDPARLATFVTDVTTAEGAASMVAASESAFGRPADTLVHLVGGFAMAALEADDAPDVWKRMMRMNLDSSFHCFRAVLPALKTRGGGWIVGVGSRAAVEPPARLAAYAASKAGMIALVRSLSAEVRAEGIHVNAILASTIDTPANRQEMGSDAARNWVRPDDIADAVLYLCSDRARAVHGATLEVYANA